jgi:cytochrome oxidase Cu insertion factor (SCO1/SenC/PrrC family)
MYNRVRWEHLQDVPQFQLTNQLGEDFDSADLAGRPMTISFFFVNCPSICRQLNERVRELRQQLRSPEMMFATISVDPERDTVEVLNRYSQDFEADAADWNFLTGQLYRIRELGTRVFGESIDTETHTENVFLVDRWGRFRDRFKWNDPTDVKRYTQVATEVLAEQAPPFGKMIRTRNLTAGVRNSNFENVPWIREFYLTNQDSAEFFSRDLVGRVWIASFFFISCPGVCVEQNQYLAGLQDRLAAKDAQLVSISTNPEYDTPKRLKTYARKIDADLNRWTFLTGEKGLIERISTEYFKAYSSGGHHSSLLYLVDRWGNVRGEFDWREPAAEVQLMELVNKLNAESAPPGLFERIRVLKEPDDMAPVLGH